MEANFIFAMNSVSIRWGRKSCTDPPSASRPISPGCTTLLNSDLGGGRKLYLTYSKGNKYVVRIPIHVILVTALV